MRKLVALAVLVLGALRWLRRRQAARRDRVTLHYDDGSAVTLERDAPAAARLTELARQAL